MPASESLSGRVVLVTGGTGLVGRGIAEAFLERGAVVAVVGSSEERLRAALGRLSSDGNRVTGLTADVRSPDQIARAFDAVERDRGPVGVLVNCAGVNPNQPILDVGEADYDRVMNTNVKAAFFASQIAGRRMAAAGGGGRIVNVTSGNYRYTRPGASTYCASKAALEMLTRAFALELGPYGITVNAVAPGLVDRDAGEAGPDFPRFSKYYVANSTLGRLTTARDVGEVAAFLASDQAASITGETIVVDGGFSTGRFDFPSNVR